MEHIREGQRNSKLKLTLRGRVVIATLITLLLLGMWALMAVLGAAKADAYIVDGSGTEGVSFETVVAFPGDTLWDIASMIAPKNDPRDVIDDLLRFNQLSNGDLTAGQEIVIPPKYSY